MKQNLDAALCYSELLTVLEVRTRMLENEPPLYTLNVFENAKN